MSGPTTEAGRALLEDWASGTFALDWAEAIAAIEAEARAPLREALIEAWAIIDFLWPEDDLVYGPFRKNVARVVRAREMAVALVPEIEQLADTAEAER